MIRLILALTLIICAALTAISQPTAGSAQSGTPRPASGPVFVELFTSQGCSSCPPADRLAEKLAREKGLILISRPVDYWDRLGWKDTLASPANTALQRAYARRGLAGYNGVYTPQTVIAGAFGEVGSDEGVLRSQIRAEKRLGNAAALSVQRVDGRGFAVGLAGKADRPAQLWLLSVSSQENIAIARGENRGRTVRYTNALIREERLMTWNGGKQGVAIAALRLAVPGADRYAVVLREPDGGQVLAARWLR